jgi:hypothetical protein
MYFKKKPVIIEAVQLVKGMDSPDWLTLAVANGRVALHGTNPVTRDQPRAEIKTLEGTMLADTGDWIIRGVNGELYPCKPDIFEKTYEPVGMEVGDGK